MVKNKLIVLVAGLLVMLTACAAQPDPQPDKNAELKQLLPSEAGYEWNYWGFAEYGHQMVLEAVEEAADSIRYVMSGEVEDMSGGESQRDFSLQITYTLQNGVWLQEKQGDMMLDSDFDALEILRTPIEAGQNWSQTQTDRQGQERTLLATIDEVNTEGDITTIAVRYQDQGSDYYEVRQIRSGVGVVLFEKLWISPEGQFAVGYSLFEGNDSP